MASLAEIRARLQEQENKQGGATRGGMDNAIYPFWNIPENSTATLRFLPDADESNTFFWRERQMIKIPLDRKSTRLNSSHSQQSRMPSSA